MTVPLNEDCDSPYIHIHPGHVLPEVTVPSNEGCDRNPRRRNAWLLTRNEKGEWKASTGSPGTKAKGKKFKWTAPNRAGTAEISLSVGKQTKQVQIEVVEPKSITSILEGEKPIPSGVIGAGMFLKFRLNPLNVSFGRVETKEVSGPASGEWGRFLSGPVPEHDSGDNFFRYWSTNWHMAQDEASLEYPDGLKPPLDPGGFKWVIPNHFRVAGEGGDGQHFTNVTQEFKVDGDGTVTINKAGQTVSRGFDGK